MVFKTHSQAVICLLADLNSGFLNAFSDQSLPQFTFWKIAGRGKNQKSVVLESGDNDTYVRDIGLELRNRRLYFQTEARLKIDFLVGKGAG